MRIAVQKSGSGFKKANKLACTLASKKCLKVGCLQTAERKRCWTETQEYFDLKMRCRFWQMGYDLRLGRLKRKRKGSYKTLSKKVGIKRSSLQKYLKAFGYERGTLRSGLCDYCFQHDHRERVKTEKVVELLAEKLAQKESYVIKDWDFYAEAHKGFGAESFDRPGHPGYWLEMFEFMNALTVEKRISQTFINYSLLITN